MQQQRPGGGPFIRDRFRSDPGYRAELRFCADRGIPHSWFLGGPYSWTEADRWKALVAHAEQPCSRCGTYSWEWQYQDEEGGWHRRKDAPWEADYWTCMGCKEFDGLMHAATDGGRQQAAHGLQVRWFPVNGGRSRGHD